VKPAPIDPPEIWPRLWEDFSGDVGWDIGANCGQTIPVMQARFNQVYAFEPAEECWPYLTDFKGHYAWFPVALSDTNNDLDLIALPDKIDTGQLVTAGTHGMEWDPDLPTALIRTIPAHTVDYMIEVKGLEAPNFMKIDTEGHELKVLFGARKTLAVQRPDLLIEFHSPQLHDSCQTLLEHYDYKIETVRHPHYRPGTPMWFAHGWFRARQ
jgi:FkbM family methyltransferase